MKKNNYFLLEDARRDVIVHGETGLRVNVFNRETEGFSPAPGEIHVVGDDHGLWLAFETEGWTMEGLEIVSSAVLWYARRLDYPQMQITTEDPRPKPKEIT